MESALSWLNYDGPEGPAQLDNFTSSPYESFTVVEALLPQAVSGLCTGEPVALPQPNGLVQLRNVGHSAADTESCWLL